MQNVMRSVRTVRGKQPVEKNKLTFKSTSKHRSQTTRVPQYLRLLTSPGEAEGRRFTRQQTEHINGSHLAIRLGPTLFSALKLGSLNVDRKLDHFPPKYTVIPWVFTSFKAYLKLCTQRLYG